MSNIEFKSDKAVRQSACPAECPYKEEMDWGDVVCPYPSEVGIGKRYKKVLHIRGVIAAFFCTKYDCQLGTFKLGSILFGGPNLFVTRPRFCDEPIPTRKKEKRG